VYLVTGGNSGIGKELAQFLYSKNGRVYIAARSKEKAMEAIDSIKKAVPASDGEMVFLHLDLADLKAVKASATEFLDRESRLHVLFNNAGVMNPPTGSKTAQGYELQLGVNCIGTFLFTKLLTPRLVETAKIEKPSTVRVVWVSSIAAESAWAPKGGVQLDNLDYKLERFSWRKYAISKAGHIYHGTEFARRHSTDGIVSIPLNPGNLDSELWRTEGAFSLAILRRVFLNPPKLGAYTELFAGLSPEVTMQNSGQYGKHSIERS
jgi:retinol dehydrogenase 12